MAATESESLKSGWLKKQGGVLKNWSVRWFKIVGDCLYYYTKDDESKLLGQTVLDGAKIIEHPINPEDPGKYIFELGAGSEQSRSTSSHECSYVLMAKSEQERQEWLNVLYKVVYGKKCGAVFYQSLEETMRYQSKKGDKLIPRIVKDCVEFIRNNGLYQEGIFRLAGSTNKIKILKTAYNVGELHPLGDKYIDVNSVASLLKMYLRELPAPLIPFDKYVHFMTAGLKIQDGDEEEELKNLQELLKQIPPISYNLLKYLCEFLHEVSENSDKNKMTAVNLATVFGPNILRVNDENPALLMGTANLTSQTTLILIQNYSKIFTMEYSITGHSVNVDNLLDFGDEAQSSPTSPSKFVNNVNRSTSLPLDDVLGSPNMLSASLPPPLLRMSDEDIAKNDHPIPDDQTKEAVNDEERDTVNKIVSPVLRKKVPLRRIKSREGHERSQTQFYEEEAALNFFGEDNCQSKVKSVIDERSKLGPSADDLQLQNSVLKAELGDMRLRYEDQIKKLQYELENTKKNCDTKIQKVEEEYRKRMDKLVDQLEDERQATLKTVERIMILQNDLQVYQLKYGPLDSTD